jgi:SAM-dependent methyltransferase
MPKLRKHKMQGLPQPGMTLGLRRSSKIMVNDCLPKVITKPLSAARRLALVLRQEIYWQPVTKPRYMACYTARADPWGYEVKKFEAEKFQAAAELLNGARDGAHFTRGWEIGCAEGVFTARLAQICRDLCAVDYIPLALDRARVRCRESNNVFFSEWDLNSDPAPGSFDLIVIMDVLGSLGGRREIRHARDKIVSALASGGYLLHCDCLGEPDRRGIQRSWWGRLRLRGPGNIRRFVAAHSALSEVASRETEMHLLALFRKD